MKFKNTYNLLDYLIQIGNEINICFDEYRGGISTTVSGGTYINIKNQLKERISYLGINIIDENGRSFKLEKKIKKGFFVFYMK